MTDVGTAALQIIPSFKGFQGKLDQGASADLARAGKAGGDKFGEEAAKAGGDGFSSKIGGSIKSKAIAGAGLAAGLAFGGAMASALEQGALSDKLAAQLGVGEKKSAELGKVAGDLYTNAYGDSMAGVNDAIRSVVTNIDGMRTASQSKLKDITATVLDLNAAFEEEPAAIAKATAQMVRTGLAGSAKEALDVITKGFQSGADKAEDLLDTYNEYGTQFRKLGIDGATATGLISQGLKGGARDADLVADTFKEFSIRAIDGSELTQASFAALGLNAGKMGADVAAGGQAAADATEAVLKKLAAVEDPATRAQIAVGLFGTQSEDMGKALYDLDLSSAVAELGKVEGAAGRMGATLSDNASTKVTAFTRKIKSGVVDFLAGEVIPALEGFADGPQARKFGEMFTQLADDARPLAKDLLPAVGSAVGALGDALSTAAPYAQDLVKAFNNMPDWAKKGIVVGGAGALAASKLGAGNLIGSSKPGASGGVLGLLSKSKPLPVFVVNNGVDVPGGSIGGKGGKIAAGAKAAGAVAAGAAPVVAGASVAAGAGTLGIMSLFEKYAPKSPLKGSPTGVSGGGGGFGAGVLDMSGMDAEWEEAKAKEKAALDYMTAEARTAMGKIAASFATLPQDVQTEMIVNGVPESRRAAMDLVRQYNLTPAQKRTLFETSGIPQNKKATSEYRSVIDGTPRQVATQFTLTGVESARAQIATLSSSLHALESRGDRMLPFLSGGARSARAGGGGVDPSTTYLVGERGPELFRPRYPGEIVPNHDLSRGGTRGSSRPAVINIHLGGEKVATIIDDRISAHSDLNDERGRANR